MVLLISTFTLWNHDGMGWDGENDDDYDDDDVGDEDVSPLEEALLGQWDSGQ